jgi:hypothetical protein
MGPALVDLEVVRLEVWPDDALTPVRRALQEAIAAVRGLEQIGESDEWIPHVSIAYSNVAGPMQPYLEALDPPFEPVSVQIPDVQLTIMERDTHLYEWQTRAVIALG